MYLPSEIVAYIADFCSVTRKATLRSVCKQFANAIRADIRRHNKCLMLLDALEQYQMFTDSYNSLQLPIRFTGLMIIKWYSVYNTCKHYIPVVGGTVTCLMDGKNNKSKHVYRYGISVCRGDIVKSDSSTIDWCYKIKCDIREPLLLYDIIKRMFPGSIDAYHIDDSHVISYVINNDMNKILYTFHCK